MTTLHQWRDQRRTKILQPPARQVDSCGKHLVHFMGGAAGTEITHANGGLPSFLYSSPSLITASSIYCIFRTIRCMSRPPRKFGRKMGVCLIVRMYLTFTLVKYYVIYVIKYFTTFFASKFFFLFSSSKTQVCLKHSLKNTVLTVSGFAFWRTQ